MALASTRNVAAADATASAQPLLVQPTHVRDELAWELVRDEWELLLAVGSGPTTVEAAARTLSTTATNVAKRMKLLSQHGLVTLTPLVDGAEAYKLVPAFYERREGMSSYLRDLVLRRLQDGAAPPLAGRARLGLGGPASLEALIVKAETELFPAVVSLANRPESDRSERFSLFFATADSPDAGSAPVQPYDGRGFRDQLLRVLKSAATAKSLAPDTRSAYLWVAEMRADPEVAVEIGELFERFLESLSSGSGSGNGTGAVAAPAGLPKHGAAAFAVLPASLHRQGES